MKIRFDVKAGEETYSVVLDKKTGGFEMFQGEAEVSWSAPFAHIDACRRAAGREWLNDIATERAEALALA